VRGVRVNDYQVVRKGAGLVRLDDNDYQAQVARYVHRVYRAVIINTIRSRRGRLDVADRYFGIGWRQKR